MCFHKKQFDVLAIEQKRRLACLCAILLEHPAKEDKIMQTAEQIKREICDIGARIYQKGFVAANDGNISVKVGPNEFYCTPTGVSKGYMTPDMIIKVDAEGNKIEGALNPSSEIKMHMRVYRERPDVGAVVHAHPPIATAFAVCQKPLDKLILPEAVLSIGTVPVCAYGTPSSMEVPDSLMPYIQDHDAFLLQNHGALSVGNTLTRAFFVMDEVEYFAKITFYASMIGGMVEFGGENIDKLMDLRARMNIPGRHPGCGKPEGAIPGDVNPVSEEMIETVTKKVLTQLGMLK